MLVFYWFEFFMLPENVYYMAVTRYSAGKIWSVICMQDIAKPRLHYQIDLIRLIWLVYSFTVYSEHRGAWRTQSNVYAWGFFAIIVTYRNVLTIFAKVSILDFWLGSECCSGISKLQVRWNEKKSRGLRGWFGWC